MLSLQHSTAMHTNEIFDGCRPNNLGSFKGVTGKFGGELIKVSDLPIYTAKYM